MIALYMDENVNGDITRALRRRGVDVLRAQDDGYMKRPDDEVLRHATELGRLLFSQDDDLLREATKLQRRNVHFSGVIYAHQMNVSVGQCVEDLMLLAEAGNLEDFVSRVYYLPL